MLRRPIFLASPHNWAPDWARPIISGGLQRDWAAPASQRPILCRPARFSAKLGVGLGGFGRLGA